MTIRTLVLACIYFIGIHGVSAQTDTPIVKREYLSSNFQTYCADQEVPYIRTVTNTVVLYGERHDEFQSQSYFLALFKSCITQDSSFRLLLERGPSEEYLLREFLRTGQRRIFLDNLAVGICSRNECKNYFSPIRNILINSNSYNDTARYFYAIDCERHFSISLMSLGFILDKCSSKLDESSGNCRDTLIRNFHSQNKKTLRGIAHYVIRDFNEDSAKYINELPKEEFWYYSRIVRALKVGLAYDSLGGANSNIAAELREEFMYNNLAKLLDENSQLRFAGEFGLTHVVGYQVRWGYYSQWESLSARIEKNNPGRLCRIANYYNKENYFENKAIIHDSEIDLFRPLFHKRDATIFDMRNGKNIFGTEFDFVQVLN